MRRWVPLLLAFLSATAFAQVTVSGPATAKVGAQVEVTVAGSKNPRDFVTIVEKSAREGAYDGKDGNPIGACGKDGVGACTCGD